MTQYEFENELKRLCDEEVAKGFSGGVAATPAWMSFVWTMLKTRFGESAPGAALSALELAGLSHEVVYKGSVEWQKNHPLDVDSVINPA